MNLEVGMHWNS